MADTSAQKETTTTAEPGPAVPVSGNIEVDTSV